MNNKYSFVNEKQLNRRKYFQAKFSKSKIKVISYKPNLKVSFIALHFLIFIKGKK